jgi:hypothetical protein
VPSSLIDAGTGALENPRMAVAIDTPEPIADLLAAARPFKAEPLPEDLPAEDYVAAFLKPFGAKIGEAVLFEDAAGTRIPVSDQLFRDRSDAGCSLNCRLAPDNPPAKPWPIPASMASAASAPVPSRTSR